MTTPNAIETSLTLKIPQVDVHVTQLPDLLWQMGPALVGGIVVGLALTFARAYVLRHLKARYSRKDAPVDAMFWLMHFMDSMKGWFIWITALYAAMRMAPPAAPLLPLGTFIFTLLALLQAGLVLTNAVKGGGSLYVQRNKKDGARATLVATMVLVLDILLWAILGLMALGVMGINVTALLAGLGLGGIVIALALKNMAEDLLSSLSIVFDQPFVLGDFIISGDYMGSVERIGMKTTRIRSLSGEQIIIPNSDLLGSRIRNYGRMKERRQVFSIGVTYETPRAKLEKIPGLIKGIIEAQKNVRFDRSHFATFGDFSLNFETVYFILSADYNQYMDIQQAINLALVKAFEKEGISFAYPTQVIYTAKA